MFFWLKKLIGYWIMPVPACALLLVSGLILLRFTRRARLGQALLVSGVVLFVLFSNKYVSAALVRPLEIAHPPIPELASAPVPPALARCRYVAVLGAGNGNTPGVAALNRLSASARARVAEAVRILRVLPDAKLLVAGPAVGGFPSHATVLERAAISLGIAPERIERLEHVRDTEDESLAVARVAEDAPVAVVTSAWHMRRAIALFRSAGVDALPCPTDYTSHSDGTFHWRDFMWDVESLERSGLAIRENVGWLWISLRGKTGTSDDL